MDYNISLMYENNEVMIYRTSSDHWFSFDKTANKMEAITEQQAIEIVYASAKDMTFACRVLNGHFRRNEQEYPQLFALLIAQLASGEAAQILSTMSGDFQTDIAMRIALLDKVSPTDILLTVAAMEKISPEQMTEFQRVFENFSDNTSSEDGIDLITQILEYMDRDNRETLLNGMNTDSEVVVAKIMQDFFVFEDLLCLDDRCLQMVLKETNTSELVIALKGASDELIEKIFSNISDRVKKMIIEEMEFMGPTRKIVVKEAQRYMIDIVRALEREQQIIIVRGPKKKGEDEFL